MPRILWPAFCGGSNVAQSSIADGQDCVNWYTEPRQVVGGKSAVNLYPTPGVEARVTAPEVPGRAFYHLGGRAFAVIGDTFYEATSASDGVLTLVERGSVAVDHNPAMICGGGDGSGQLFITSGDVGYCYDLTSNTLTIERPSGNTMCAWLDGYFLVLDAATSTFYVSALLDATTWDPLDYAQRNTAADNWVAMVVPQSSREIWLLGEETSEIWDGSGAQPFPWVPVPNALIAYGCAAPFSARDVDGAMIWVAQNRNGRGSVVAVNASGSQAVSSTAMSWAIHNYDTVEDAIASSYAAAGHVFYLLTFPTEGVTWCLDLTTREWARRGTWVSEENAWVAWRPTHHVFAWGRHLALDSETGTVYEVSESYGYDVDARPIRRLRRTPSVWNSHDPITVDCVEVFLEAGLGASTGRGVNPTMTMRLSKDGGKTWGSERTRSAGAIGQYDTRLRWWRCGTAEDLVGEFVVTDPVPFRVIGASLTVRPRRDA